MIYNNIFKNCDNNNYIYFANEYNNNPENNIFWLNKFDSDDPISTLIGNESLIGNQFWNSTEEQSYIFNNELYSSKIGNYWNNYNGIDINEDGIGDTSFELYENIYDYYPLVQPSIIDENDDIDDNINLYNQNGGGSNIIIPSNDDDNSDNSDNYFDSNIENGLIWDKIKDIFNPYIPDWLNPDNNDNNNNNNSLNTNNLFDSSINDLPLELMLDLDLLETSDLNGDETFLELMNISIKNHPNNFLIIIILILILFSIGYYLKK